MIEKKRIQIRRDLEQNWVEINPILLYGEIGFDLTNNKIKIGDGERPWNELSWVNEANIDLSNYYTKEEIGTILNELNTNISNDYYTKEQTTTEIQNTIDSTLLSYYNKEQVDEIVSNIEIGGGGSIGTTNYNELENRPTTNIQGLTYEQGYELMEYINNNKELPYPLSLQGIYLNDCRLVTVEPNFIEINIDGLNSKQVRLWLNPDEQSFSVDYLDWIPSTDVIDVRLIPLQKRDEFFNYLTSNLSFPENCTVVAGGIILNGLEVSNPYEDNESIEIHFKYYSHPKSYDFRLLYFKENKFISYDLWEMENKELVTKEQVDELISNSGGSGESADLSNYFTKEETITEIQNAIDNIEIPTTDLSDYYTKAETNTEIQNAIDGIEIPTTDLSDYYTKAETNTEIQNAIDGIEIPEQQEVSNATITIVQGDSNQSFNLNQSENQIITLGNKDINWFGNETNFESLPDEQKVNGLYYLSDKIDYKADITGQPYIVYKTSQLLNDKPFATTNDIPKEWFGTQEEFDLLETYETNTTYYIETTANSGGESVDLSNYFTKEETYSKEETNTEIQNAIDNIEIPTTDLSNYYNKQEIDNIVGLINNELEIIING